MTRVVLCRRRYGMQESVHKRECRECKKVGLNAFEKPTYNEEDNTEERP